MGACASAAKMIMPPQANKGSSSSTTESAGDKLEAAVKTLMGLNAEINKMGVKCFPAADIAKALPAYIWDLEKEPPIDYSKPSKKGKHPKTEFTPYHQAMAILADIAYLKGSAGEVQNALFDSAFKLEHIHGKNPAAELASRGVVLSKESFAQHGTYESQKGKPCWFSAADEQKKVVYVVVRGTDSINDILSDLNIQVDEITLCGHPCKVHAGINASAKFVIEDSKDRIAPYLAKGFSLVFTGHSLGAGTAALAAAHSRSGSEDGYKDATAVTFACPGIISGKENGKRESASKAMKAFVTTFILGYDIVPRATGVAIFNLLDKIFSNNWKEKILARIEAEARKKLGPLGNMKLPMPPSGPKTPAQLKEEAEAKAAREKVLAEIAEGRKKISEYPHILPGGALRHFVKSGNDKSTFISKKKNFHQVIISPSDPGAFVQNHSMGQYLEHLGL